MIIEKKMHKNKHENDFGDYFRKKRRRENQTDFLIKRANYELPLKCVLKGNSGLCIFADSFDSLLFKKYICNKVRISILYIMTIMLLEQPSNSFEFFSAQGRSGNSC